MLVFNSRPKSVNFGSALAAAVDVAGFRVPGVQILTMMTTLIAGGALVLFLRYATLGVEIRAAAEDFSMAQLLGVRANRVIAVSFAISGLLGALVSLLVVQTGTLDYRIGIISVIYGFFATVIGGMGSLAAAALGGFLVGSASQLMQAWLPPDLRPFRDAFVFGLVIVVLLFRLRDLLGRELPGSGFNMGVTRERALELAGAAWSVLALALPLGLLVSILPWLDSPSLEQTVIDALVKIVAVVGLYVFIGNSGIMSFGHVCLYGHRRLRCGVAELLSDAQADRYVRIARCPSQEHCARLSRDNAVWFAGGGHCSYIGRRYFALKRHCSEHRKFRPAFHF